MNRAPQRPRASAVASLSLAAVVAALLPALPAQADARPEASESTLAAPAGADATDRFIVKFRDRAGRVPLNRARSYGRAADALDLPLKEVRATASGARVLRTPEPLGGRAADELVAQLEADPAVAYAEPDTIMYPAADPSDAFYGQQWSLWDHDFGIRAADSWGTSRGEGVVVAVVDTGITKHPDLNANVLPGYDMVSDPAMSRDGNGRDADATDQGDWCGAGTVSSWHGTHVAGIIAAVTGNGAGVAGVAPGAKILPVRALGACGGYTSDITDGIVWAAGGAVPGVPANPTPAKVVNLSVGGDGACSLTEQAAINRAVRAGAVVVVAAGNGKTSAANSSPANCGNVITVGASGPTGKRAPYSNYGAAVDVAAPGGDFSFAAPGGILSTLNGGATGPGVADYYFSEGTSMAAPHVAGTAALLMAAEPTLTPAQVEARIKGAARPMPSCATLCGGGLLDAPAALGLNGRLGLGMVRGTPAISGVALAGRALTANTGTWKPDGIGFTYQWYSDGYEIPGATGRQYTSDARDVATLLTVVVKGTKAGYRTVAKRSADFGPILFPIVAGTPRIGGTPAVGGTLTASPGTWTPGATLKYQWFHVDAAGTWTAIPKATVSTYRPASADVGRKLTVRVTGAKTGYAVAAKTSAATAAVTKGTLTGAVPFISGTRKVGHTLKAVHGTWTYRTTLGYQWYRSGVAIKGATSSAYRPTASDVGERLAVRVTGTKSGYTTRSRLSVPTASIAKGTLSGVAPTISGTPRVGYTLHVAAGTWTYRTTFGYQWYRSGVAVKGATARSYRLVSIDRADTMRVRVTGSKTGYSTSHRMSAATAVVR